MFSSTYASVVAHVEQVLALALHVPDSSVVAEVAATNAAAWAQR